MGKWEQPLTYIVWSPIPQPTGIFLVYSHIPLYARRVEPVENMENYKPPILSSLTIIYLVYSSKETLAFH